jgi:tRNA(Ile)-lysidine synthase TilS/MesJ
MSISCDISNIKTKPIPVIEIEGLINKTYKKYLFRPFIKGIQDYDLINENDKIALCVSGGKDSLLMVKLFQELKKHRKFSFDFVCICMDPGYTQNNLELLKYNCENLGIDLIIRKSDYFSVVEKIAKEHPCYLCARMRRGFLYDMAKSLGCNKIALAHHFDDAIETTLLNMFYGSSFKTMVPKIVSQNFKDMELIRPLIYVKESDILKWKYKANITTLDCACTVAALKTSSKRHEIKQLINNLRRINPEVDKSIYNSASNIVVDASLGYTKNGIKYNFNDIYEDNRKCRSEDIDE